MLIATVRKSYAIPGRGALSLALCVILSLAACDSHPSGSGRHAADFPTNVTAYEVKGVLQEIRANGWKALITHEDIPGYMEAMTMLLDVKETNELVAVRPGDTIHFRMLVTETDGWIDRVRRSGTNTAPALAASAVPAWIEELEPGAPLPDCVLTNQLGEAIRLSDFKGKALVFTFIFTRCPFPTFCPRMNNNLGAVQRALSQPGLGTNWHLLSISFDPDFDTPARLARYAASYRYDPAHWSFATGPVDDIRKLGGGFGLTFRRTDATIEHNVRTIIVDPDGRIHRVLADNEWKPEEVVVEIKKFIAIKP